jgi:hypothetical protein
MSFKLSNVLHLITSQKSDIILSLLLKKVTLVLLSRKIIEIADLNRILIRMCAFRN